METAAARVDGAAAFSAEIGTEGMHSALACVQPSDRLVMAAMEVTAVGTCTPDALAGMGGNGRQCVCPPPNEKGRRRAWGAVSVVSRKGVRGEECGNLADIYMHNRQRTATHERGSGEEAIGSGQGMRLRMHERRAPNWRRPSVLAELLQVAVEAISTGHSAHLNPAAGRGMYT